MQMSNITCSKREALLPCILSPNVWFCSKQEKEKPHDSSEDAEEDDEEEQ